MGLLSVSMASPCHPGLSVPHPRMPQREQAERDRGSAASWNLPSLPCCRVQWTGVWGVCTFTPVRKKAVIALLRRSQPPGTWHSLPTLLQEEIRGGEGFPIKHSNY